MQIIIMRVIFMLAQLDSISTGSYSYWYNLFNIYNVKHTLTFILYFKIL